MAHHSLRAEAGNCQTARRGAPPPAGPASAGRRENRARRGNRYPVQGLIAPFRSADPAIHNERLTTYIYMHCGNTLTLLANILNFRLRRACADAPGTSQWHQDSIRLC
jgi:hypothetical protein